MRWTALRSSPALSGDIRPEMVAALDQLKAEGFALGCITNNVPAGQRRGHGAQRRKGRAVEAIMARFDHVIESSRPVSANPIRAFTR